MTELPNREAHRVLLARRRDELAAGARHRGWKLGRDLPGVDGVALGYLTSTIVADSFHRAVAYGPAIGNPSIGAATLTIDGTRHAADREPEDPRAVLRAVSELLTAVGEQLRPGDHLLCGSLVHVPIPPDAQLTAAIAGLGHVSVDVGCARRISPFDN